MSSDIHPNQAEVYGMRCSMSRKGNCWDTQSMMSIAPAAGLRLGLESNAIFRYLPEYIEEGRRRGDFADVPPDIVLDMVAGAALVALDRLARGRTARDYRTATRRSYGRRSAKVIDEEMRLSNSPEEALSIAIKLTSSKYAQALPTRQLQKVSTFYVSCFLRKSLGVIPDQRLNA
jgi:hypothetical protein